MLYSQGLDGAQGGEEAFADSLQLVIVQRQQVEVLQVLEGVDPQTVDFIGVQQPGRTTTGSLEKKIIFSATRTQNTCIKDTCKNKTTSVWQILSFLSAFSDQGVIS